MMEKSKKIGGQEVIKEIRNGPEEDESRESS
jgi:hypothetical protein